MGQSVLRTIENLRQLSGDLGVGVEAIEDTSILAKPVRAGKSRTYLGVAKFGIAPGLGPGDRRFESFHLDFTWVCSWESRLSPKQPYWVRILAPMLILHVTADAVEATSR